MEFWYDPNHTGNLRILDHTKRIIHGSDPKEKYWSVSFEYEDKNKKVLKVDFSNKKTQYGNKIQITKYEDRNMTLHWQDGNKWRRIKNDPRILLNKI